MSKSYVSVRVNNFFGLFEEFLAEEGNRHTRIYHQPKGMEGGCTAFTVGGKYIPNLKILDYTDYVTLGNHNEYAEGVQWVTKAFFAFLDGRGVSYTIII